MFCCLLNAALTGIIKRKLFVAHILTKLRYNFSNLEVVKHYITKHLYNHWTQICHFRFNDKYIYVFMMKLLH